MKGRDAEIGETTDNIATVVNLAHAHGMSQLEDVRNHKKKMCADMLLETKTIQIEKIEIVMIDSNVCTQCVTECILVLVQDVV